ncbi:MAG: hypothetical protein HWD61_15850 [Parachlamydiaceae bacterium]|nr:MAG: hypothetical protein HWD61_15850 [Parachlamydiaceae bacterium]
MKDAVHHLKRVQRKVIQESRKSSGGTKAIASESLNHQQIFEENSPTVRLEKRADTNHRVPRLRNNRSMVH